MADELQKLFPKRSDTFPQATAADTVYNVANTGLSLIPVFGQMTVGVLNHFLIPQLTQRKDDYLKDLADDFEALKEKVDSFDIPATFSSESFVSSVIQTTRIAAATHQGEKKQMLRNALLNIATDKAPEEDMQHIYIQMIERLTPSHVKILQFLHSPHKYLAQHFSDPNSQSGLLVKDAIPLVMPEFTYKTETIKSILLDLYNSNLIPRWGDNTVIQSPSITNNGIAFLNFVLTSPLD